MAIFRPGRVAALASLVLLVFADTVSARVISYAPLTSRTAIPAVQRRTNRHALLIEQTGIQTFVGGGPSCLSCGYSSPSRLVLHDSLGQEEPRDVTPGGVDTGIDFAAAREEAGFPPVLLAHSSAGLFAGENPTSVYRFLFSADGGTTWSVLPLPSASAYLPWSADIGGPFVRARDSAVRIGTAASPFFLALFESDMARIGLWDVFANGGVARRAFASSDSSLVGTDAEGRRALLSGTPLAAPGPGSGNATPALYVVNPDGSSQALADRPANTYFRNGWITPDGRAYVEADTYTSTGSRHALFLAAGGGRLEIAAAVNPSPTDLFAVPTPDFSGAWVLQRGTGPTVLSLHTPAAGLVEAWHDVTRPEVEALHVGASGKRLLVQVHRPRPQVDQRVFKDPALAVWEVGQPAPASYDELFVNEQTMKAFVHVDPDTIAQRRALPVRLRQSLARVHSGRAVGRRRRRRRRHPGVGRRARLSPSAPRHSGDRAHGRNERKPVADGPRAPESGPGARRRLGEIPSERRMRFLRRPTRPSRSREARSSRRATSFPRSSSSSPVPVRFSSRRRAAVRSRPRAAPTRARPRAPTGCRSGPWTSSPGSAPASPYPSRRASSAPAFART